MGSRAIATGAAARAGTSERAQVLRAALGAALLGVLLVWGVGFAPLEAVHNAAHDVRHSAAFPCH